MQLQPVGLTSRLSALIVDGFIVGIPSAALTIPLFGVHELTRGHAGTALTATLLITAISATYEILLISLRGATFGMSFCGFRITSDPDQFAPVSLQASALRYVVKTLEPLTALATAALSAFVGLFWYVVIAVSINGNPEKRGYHDRAAKTWAVSKRNDGKQV